LSDDLNTHGALSALLAFRDKPDAVALARGLVFLGLMSWNELEKRVADLTTVWSLTEPVSAHLHELRRIALESKDFSKVDAIKERLAAANFSVQMGKEKTVIRPEMGFDRSVLEGLL
jgi:cysteinyl-tRNA synthetase